MTVYLTRLVRAALVGCFSLILASTSYGQSTPPKPLVNAHAHNDYAHDRPLLDALDHGFTSIEADIFLVDGELLVAHYLKDVQKERTLDSLYLKPLWERFEKNQGSIYVEKTPITLLVDIKNQGPATYAVLHQQLERYSKMLSATRDGVHKPGAVTVIVSGDRPVEQIKSSNPRLVGIDGRIADLKSDSDASLFPLISDNWQLQFKYRGKGEFSADEKTKLQDIVKQAHTKGRRVRFWATAESEELWSELRKADVDLIGTDNLEKLSNYLKVQP